MLIVALLSQYSLIGFLGIIFSSSSTLFSHNNSHIPYATTLYSTSALLLATTVSSLLRHKIRLLPTKAHHPKVHLLSVRIMAHYWNGGYTIEKVAHYWNDGYTIGMVVILLKRWLTIGMVAILLEWWLYY